MKLIVDLLRRVWPPRPDTGGSSGRGRDSDDRSSMADFVRLLQMHDQNGGRPNYPS
jgi:hypothetical protein